MLKILIYKYVYNSCYSFIYIVIYYGTHIYLLLFNKEYMGICGGMCGCVCVYMYVCRSVNVGVCVCACVFIQIRKILIMITVIY